QQETTDGLPAKIDLRNYNGKNYVTPAKKQLFGDCWTFATTGAAETTYLLANDMGVPAGEVNDAVNFSEKYIAWYAYHSITDDDVITGKVRKSQVGEGFDVSQLEAENGNAIYMLGGGTAGAAMFAAGFMPVDEKVSVNNEYPYAYGGKNAEVIDGELQALPDDDWSLPLNAQYRNTISNPYFRSCRILPSPAFREDCNSEYKFDEAGVTAIKSELAKGHAVVLGYHASDNMNFRTWATYSHQKTSNHGVAIIGYDDNYSKDNFARKASSGKIIDGSVPPADGAFIAKNSWGEWGENGSGCFYISYYDESIVAPASFEFDKNDSVICKNPNYDQYDMFVSATYANIDYEEETKIANVFDAEMDQTLYQIEYMSPEHSTVHYAIYKGVENNNPESGTLLEEGDKTHEFNGCFKIDLNGKYDLKKDEKYSIVLTINYTDRDGKSYYTDIIPYGTSFQDGVVAKTVVNSGESYLFTDSKWTDAINLKDTYLQKAYEHNINDILDEAYKVSSVDYIAVDNYPIKGISIPKN
ncbi:MAG: C1 family peptidase, partial [Acutalibacteraceae bacterium]|nr:C1 family peptidase [Acutalibacteraceae bacterium]